MTNTKSAVYRKAANRRSRKERKGYYATKTRRYTKEVL